MNHLPAAFFTKLILISSLCLPVKALTQQFIYTFNHLSTVEGLSSGEYNYYVYQDQKSLVWISSIKGLNRFDGKRVHTYHSQDNNVHSLKNEFASQSKFQEDHKEDIWFTTEECLTRYNRTQDQFDHFYFESEGKRIDSWYYWAHLDSVKQILFVSAGKQLYTLDVNRPDSSKQLLDDVYVGLKDRMFRTADGRNCLMKCGYGNDTLEVRYYKDQQLVGPPRSYSPAKASGIKINDVLYVSQELSWVATSQGLYRLNLRDGSWTPVSVGFQQGRVENVIEIAQRKNGQILLATQKDGIYFFDPLQDRYIGQIHVLQKNSIVPFKPFIERMTLDKRENLWVSVKNDGVYYTQLDHPKFDLRFLGDPEQVNTINALANGQDGTIWAALPNRVAHLSGDEVFYYPLPLMGSDLEETTSILADSRGRIWVGTLEHLYVLQAGATDFETFNPLPEGMQDQRPGYNSFHELPSHDLLIATNSLYTLQLKADLSRSFWIDTLLTSPFGFCHNAKEEDLLIHTYHDSLALGYLKDDFVFQIDTCIAEMAFISSIVYDEKRDWYWLGTFRGLYRLAKMAGSWTLSASDISDISINSMLIDEEGALWMAIPGGLMYYQDDTKQKISYTLADGLQGSEYKLGSALKGPDQRMYFGGFNGLTIFDPSSIKPTAPAARPIIVDIKINQESGIAHRYSQDGVRNPMLIKHLKVPYPKNNLTFSLAALEYSDPDACRFRYKLEGDEEAEWIALGSNALLEFARLGPDHYTLSIQATNADGQWSDITHRLQIHVRTPIYLSPWFYAGLVVLMGLVFIYVYRRNQERYRREQALKRKAAEIETSVLRLQMNPHFIFNSLQAIAFHILQANNQNAYDLLTSFADLMRDILDRSEQLETNLENEIDLLTRYIEAQQIRFPHISFDFYTGSELDREHTFIPTMMLQPLVENAIEHGLKDPNHEEAHVQVSFQKIGAVLLCEVKDNGSGRRNSKTEQKHQSKALQITERRLALLSTDKSKQLARIEILDETDAEGKASGTTVRVFLPLNS